MRPGARPVLDDQYFRRISAIEFAVRFDDGVPSGLHDADIVLVGVSRTSKTPLSMYLGYLGYKTANVPIVKGIKPPKELFEVDSAAHRRADDRGRAPRRDPPGAGEAARRLESPQLHGADGDLRGARRSGRDPAQARRPVIDTTELSIEETASRVIRLVEHRLHDQQKAKAKAG